jgi:hypothetical protein
MVPASAGILPPASRAITPAMMYSIALVVLASAEAPAEIARTPALRVIAAMSSISLFHSCARIASAE